MNTIAMTLLTLCIIGLLLCFTALADDAKATKFIEDIDNQRKIRKCFGQEGLQIYFKYNDHTAYVHFHHKGTSYEKTLPYTKVVSLYQSNPTGQGLRKIFIENVK